MNQIPVEKDKKNLKQAIKTQKRIQPILKRAKSILTPIDPYYKVQSALDMIAKIKSQTSIAPMSSIFTRNHVVTLYRAIQLVSLDYHKHPSKTREYQLMNLETLHRLGHCGFYHCFYVQDTSPMSVYNRLQCTSASRKNVLDIIDTIKSFLVKQVKMYKRAVRFYISPQTLKKCKQVFGKERIKTPQKLVIPF